MELIWELIWELIKNAFLNGLIAAMPLYGLIGSYTIVFWGCKMWVCRGENDRFDWDLLCTGIMFFAFYFLVNTMIAIGVI